MHEEMIYINHLNESIRFGENGVFVNYNDLRDFSWGNSVANNRISSFSKGVVQKTIPVVIACPTAEDGAQVKNRIFEIFEKDVLAVRHGRLHVNGYYLKCFITQSQKSNYLITRQYTEITLGITTDYPNWIKETTHVYSVAGTGTGGAGYLDYPHDFPFDYMSLYDNRYIRNLGISANNFKMVIYGPCSRPSLYIAEHLYQVSADLSPGDYLIIDSIEKTILLYKNNGQIVNCFALRDRDSYIFEKIPPGDNTVTWNGNFGFDITLYEERSEPRWI